MKSFGLTILKARNIWIYILLNQLYESYLVRIKNNQELERTGKTS
jgi:hypothetical protein